MTLQEIYNDYLVHGFYNLLQHDASTQCVDWDITDNDYWYRDHTGTIYLGDEKASFVPR